MRQFSQRQFSQPFRDTLHRMRALWLSLQWGPLQWGPLQQSGGSLAGWPLKLSLGLLTTLLVASPTHAAENIRFQFGLYELTVTRQELETFAETGIAEGGLDGLLSRLDPGLREQFGDALQAEYELDPVLANRFSYTASGEQLLREAGELIQTDSRQNGFLALRGTLTLAAAKPEGLTILGFLEQFPSDIRINIRQAMETAEAFGNLLSQTQQAVTQLKVETDVIAASEPAVDFSRLPDPRLAGEQGAVMQTLTLYDAARDRTIITDVYTPEIYPDSASTDSASTDSAGRVPVIVVSNGLGARRDRFEALAKHLASHGFAVALPDHPGSDRERLRDFYDGLESENFEPTEYLDRPQDVSFVLDELSRLNGEIFRDRLDPNRAGVFGYSFGGTTALALAGAEIDRNHLQQACDTRSSIFNISLLYQCRALELPDTSTDFKDERVQAVYVFVPFSRSLYGPKGLSQVEGPVLWEATDQDILTPFMMEQLPAFSWLTANDSAVADLEQDRYLAVTAGLPHARITFEVLSRLTSQKNNWEDIGPIAESYHQMLNVAFFQVHLAENEDYRPYLQARGAQRLTQAPYPLTWRDTPLSADFLEN